MFLLNLQYRLIISKNNYFLDKITFMNIVDKLNQQIDNLQNDIIRIKQEKNELIQTIIKLQDDNDQLKYNNENMLLNIDKVLQSKMETK